MISKLYLVSRLLGYVVSLVGIFYYLHHQASLTGYNRAVGLGIVGVGFVFFFLSYALRAWLRFAPRRGHPTTPGSNPPAA